MFEERVKMLYLITGGSGSGKSEYAEKLAVTMHQKGLAAGGLFYIATMYPYDWECEERICKHQAMRKGKGFQTQECFVHLEQIHVGEKDVVLLECMSNLLANEMYQKDGSLKERGKAADLQLETAVLKPLLCLGQKAGCLVVVTNEVFSDGMQYEEGTEEYVRLLGKANTFLAQRADAVIEVVCSIPLLHFHKSKDGGLPC